MIPVGHRQLHQSRLSGPPSALGAIAPQPRLRSPFRRLRCAVLPAPHHGRADPKWHQGI